MPFRASVSRPLANMATRQPPWLYIVQGSCALFITIINLGPLPLSKYNYIAPTVCPSSLHYFSLLLTFLLLLYIGDFVVFLVKSLRQNKLPNTTATFCKASLSLSITFEIE